MIMLQADRPATGFRPLFNPATGEWITYTALAQDSGGQLVRFTLPACPAASSTSTSIRTRKLAKAFGIRPYYGHWDSRTRATG